MRYFINMSLGDVSVGDISVVVPYDEDHKRTFPIPVSKCSLSRDLLELLNLGELYEIGYEDNTSPKTINTTSSDIIKADRKEQELFVEPIRQELPRQANRNEFPIQPDPLLIEPEQRATYSSDHKHGEHVGRGIRPGAETGLIVDERSRPIDIVDSHQRPHAHNDHRYNVRQEFPPTRHAEQTDIQLDSANIFPHNNSMSNDLYDRGPHKSAPEFNSLYKEGAKMRSGFEEGGALLTRDELNNLHTDYTRESRQYSPQYQQSQHSSSSQQHQSHADSVDPRMGNVNFKDAFTAPERDDPFSGMALPDIGNVPKINPNEDDFRIHASGQLPPININLDDIKIKNKPEPIGGPELTGLVTNPNSGLVGMPTFENPTTSNNDEIVVGSQSIDAMVFSDFDNVDNDEAPVKQEKQRLEIEWHGPFHDAGGYARMNREIAMGLSRMGVNVKTDIEAKRNMMETIDISPIEQMQNNVLANPDKATRVYGMLAPRALHQSKYRKCIFTMMESSAVGSKYMERCQYADELWVPSEFNVDIFKKAGFKKPIIKIPLGVDTDLYRPNLDPIKGINPDNQFMFMSVFGWSLRKGYDLLIPVFLRTFTKKDNVSLLIVSRIWGSADPEHKNEIKREIARLRQAVIDEGRDKDDLPDIKFFGDLVPEKMMPNLYNTANAFVLTSRGEGWGLPYMEASACGLPVIGTRHGGQLDFLNDDNSYLIDFDGYEQASKELTLKVSTYYEGQPFPKFGDVATRDLTSAMRSVFENKTEAKTKARKLRQDILGKYTWNHVCQNVYNRLEAINKGDI